MQAASADVHLLLLLQLLLLQGRMFRGGTTTLSSTGRLRLVDGTVNLRLLSYNNAAAAVAAAVAAGSYWVHCARRKTHGSEQADCGYWTYIKPAAATLHRRCC
jgi:hypothetical protein